MNKSGGAAAIAGQLAIGDQRNVIAGDPTTGPATYASGFGSTSSGAIVQLLAANQIAPTDFWGVNINSVGVFPSGELDLNGFGNVTGNISMWTGPTFSAQISTAPDAGGTAGILQLMGTSITQNASAGTSVSSPPAVIAGQLDLSNLFSGGGAGNGVGVYHNITVNGKALSGFEQPDLNITAVISGGAGYGLQRTGAGNLELSGANTYSGPTNLGVINGNGFTTINSNSAFGNSSLVNLANSGSVETIGSGTFTVANPIEIDNSNVYFYVPGQLNFTGATTFSSFNGNVHNLWTYNPAGVVNFAGPVGESIWPGQNVTKGGEGTLEFSGVNQLSGTFAWTPTAARCCWRGPAACWTS